MKSVFFFLKKVTLNLKNAKRIGAGSQLTGMRSEVATTGNIEPQFVEVQIACRDVGGLRDDLGLATKRSFWIEVVEPLRSYSFHLFRSPPGLRHKSV